MNYRVLSFAVVAAGVIQAISTGSSSLVAQGQTTTGAAAKWAVPRTAWGHPDLQGKWAMADTGTPMERPKEFADREFLTDQELAAKLAAAKPTAAPAEEADPAFPEIKKAAAASHEKGIRGEEYNRFWVDAGPSELTPWKRTSLVVDPPDGRMPPLTLAAVKRLETREAARRGRGEADGWEDRNLSERCLLTAFVRFSGSGTGTIKQFIQTPSHVAMIVFALNANDPIVVPLDGRPRPSESVRTWLGIPRGHWEGTTLVVETTQINNRQDGGAVMPSRSPFAMPSGSHIGPGDTVRLTERFTRVSPDMMEYRYTIDDPQTYVRPYTVLRPLTRQPDDLLMPENGCHEGNYGIVGQLSAGRVDESYASKAAQAEADGRLPQLQEMKRRAEEWARTHDTKR
jgi:hypothetical protein